MNNLHHPLNPLKDGYYLTDGGLETTMIFHEGYELNHFAAFELLNHPRGRNSLKHYYQSYLKVAQKFGVNFILEAPTWRANKDWGYKLGYNESELYTINQNAVSFIKELKQEATKNISHVITGAQIGPRGDGYVVGENMSVDQARLYHLPQIEACKQEGTDIVIALTMTYSEEAIGIILAARENLIPVAISFTVETNGNLPSGESLSQAIERTDQLTNSYASYFMINCAHPQHFKHVLENNHDWKYRIKGIRANASTLSHAELDDSKVLDAGNKCLLAKNYRELQNLLPAIQIFGGCCGTDDSHISAVCEHLFRDQVSDRLAV